MTRDADVERALALVDEATIVADASSLILAPSENPGGTEARAARALAAIASRLGGRVALEEAAPGRPNASVRFGPDVDASGSAGLLFLGHSDVVPAGPGWTRDPFAPTVVDGTLVGRGATDMKGGLAAVLQALAAVHRIRPDVPLELLVTADEEDLALGMAAQLRHPPRPYLACIVAEPTDLATVVACRGASNHEIVVHGRAAHAGRPEDGASAIAGAAAVVDAILADHAALRAGASGLLGSASWSVGRIDGGHATSIVPDRCTLLVDRRLLPGEDAGTVLQALLAEVRPRVESLGCTVEGATLMAMPGFTTDAAHPLVDAAVAALAAEGRTSRVEVWTAACEGGFVAEHHGCPTIILGPGDITGQAHQPDEHVRIADLGTAARAYVRLAMALAG
ncbi:MULTISPECIES: M20 family metallopeptidase [unclassified Agrococcus]|uniref:M20 family metallopeptidase n=1 Tax=unclassified Agrococcus TaxID=2615065 RepID=UPI0036154769